MTYDEVRKRLCFVTKSTIRITALFTSAGITGALLTGNPIFLSVVTTSLLPTLITMCETSIRPVDSKPFEVLPPEGTDIIKSTMRIILTTVGTSIPTNLILQFLCTSPIPFLNQLLISTVGGGLTASGLHLVSFLKKKMECLSIESHPIPEEILSIDTSARDTSPSSISTYGSFPSP